MTDSRFEMEMNLIAMTRLEPWNRLCMLHSGVIACVWGPISSGAISVFMRGWSKGTVAAHA